MSHIIGITLDFSTAYINLVIESSTWSSIFHLVIDLENLVYILTRSAKENPESPLAPPFSPLAASHLLK